MNNTLITKVTNFNFEALFKKLGYSFFTKGDYNLNLIGVRSSQLNQSEDKFNDVFLCMYKEKGMWTRIVLSCTTDPGLYYLENPQNKKGTAILVPGQYKGAFKKGLHKGKYPALVQVKSLKIYRDNNKDSILDLDTNNEIEAEGIGLNIHSVYSENNIPEKIGKWSAGCTVIPNLKLFNKFLNVCDQSIKIFGNNFTYTLINENDLNI